MKTFRLWEGDAPFALGKNDEDIPTLTVISDDKAGQKRPAFVVCPGGGYGALADHEGLPIAEWFESIGVRAFVLKYRLGPRYHHPVVLGDAERAIRMVRSNATAFGVDPGRIGILGFSAGGHLASTASTHYSPGKAGRSDTVELVSSRPDASILIYPVITLMPPFAHEGSRENLLGKSPDPKLVEGLSNQKAVSLDTPPTFIFHGADDHAVPIENALMYATALSGHKVPFELHIPHHGDHGFGLGTPGSPQDWRKLAERWLQDNKFVSA